MHHGQVGFIQGMVGTVNIKTLNNIVHHFNRMKKKSYDYFN